VTVAELYESEIKRLPVIDRLELAKLILSGIPSTSIVDVSDEWTDEDLRDFSDATWQRVADGELDRDD
jgi:hypothetical protein